MCARAHRLLLLSVVKVQRALPRINIRRDFLGPRATFFVGGASDLSRMSRSSSSLQRMLDSPFSHKDLYGTRHPSEARKKGRRRRVRNGSFCRKSSTSSGTYRAASKTPNFRPPAVDYISPKLKAKQPSVMASTSEVNPSISASTLVGSPRVSAITTCSGRRIPSGSYSLFRFNPVQGCNYHQVDRCALSACLTQNLSTVALKSSDRKTLSVTRRWWTQRDAFQRRGGHSQCLTLEELARGLMRRQYQKIVVMSGAGVSTSSGIPDFRTPGTGLYDNLQQYKIPEPSAIFDITFFFHNPKPFFTLAKELYPGTYAPNAVHYFVRLLQDKGLLLRNYTQNIDGLERMAGVKPSKLVEAHGSFLSASCALCHTRHDPQLVKELIFADKVPKCKQKFCSGVVKPDIVFFGEDLPNKFYSMKLLDLSQCDLLFVLGTSLEVEPFASLVTMTRFDVPRVLINREAVGLFRHRGKRAKDVALIGDLVGQVQELARLAGWLQELEQLMQPEQKSTVEVEKISQDGTVGEPPCSSAPGNNAGNVCISNLKQQHLKCTPQQEEKRVECPSAHPDPGSSLEQVRLALDELHIQKKSSIEDKGNDG